MISTINSSRAFKQCEEYLVMIQYYQSKGWVSAEYNVRKIYECYKKMVVNPKLLVKLSVLEELLK